MILIFLRHAFAIFSLRHAASRFDAFFFDATDADFSRLF